MIDTRTALEYARQDEEYARELRIYYWKCFASEFSKIIIFLLAFALMGLIREYFAALIFLMLVRKNGGGLHFQHYTSCLVVSFSFLLAVILLGKYLMPSQVIICSATLLSAIPAYFLVPIVSDNRPEPTEEQIRRSKRGTIGVILFIFILMCFCPPTAYLYIGFWTVMLHIIQLFIAKRWKEVRRCSVTDLDLTL